MRKTLFVILIIVCVCIILYKINKWTNMVTTIVLNEFPNVKTILDIGSGTGCATQNLVKLGKCITRIDVADYGIKYHPIVFDGINIPFNNKSFDLGICAYVLHHADKPHYLLQEIKRTCKCLLLFEDTPTTSNEMEYARQHATSQWTSYNHKQLDDISTKFKNANEWHNILTSMGFTIIKSINISKWTFPFSKHPLFYPITRTIFVCNC